MAMAQLNINVTDDFEKNIKDFMRIRGISSKAEAIRIAIREGLDRSIQQARVTDFSKWIGLGCEAPENPNPRFASDDELWG
jgi:hypothetical protein